MNESFDQSSNRPVPEPALEACAPLPDDPDWKCAHPKCGTPEACSRERKTCPACGCPLTRTEEGGPEHDEWGREMHVLPEVRYFECGRVEVDTEVHESDACAVIAKLKGLQSPLPATPTYTPQDMARNFTAGRNTGIQEERDRIVADLRKLGYLLGGDNRTRSAGTRFCLVADAIEKGEKYA
jgi:hypothetical protein